MEEANKLEASHRQALNSQARNIKAVALDQLDDWTLASWEEQQISQSKQYDAKFPGRRQVVSAKKGGQ